MVCNILFQYEKEEQEQEMTDMKLKNEKERIHLGMYTMYKICMYTMYKICMYTMYKIGFLTSRHIYEGGNGESLMTVDFLLNTVQGPGWLNELGSWIT
jgi:hypothetical protein